MKANNVFFLLTCFALGAASALAGPRTSLSYTVTTDSIAIGGQRAISGSYKHDGGAALLGGTSSAASPIEIAKAGYIAQLYDLQGLTVSASPSNVNETGTSQLNAIPLLDDGTKLSALPAASVVWSIVSGPLASISNAGVATTSNVYQDTAAVASGSYQNSSGQVYLTVLNVATDDFGTYANDGIDDAWQVRYFGENNPQASPTSDPDGDGQDNKFEWIAGLVPTDPGSRFTLSIGAVAGQSSQKKIVFSPRFGDRNYLVVSKVSLSDPAWDSLTSSSFTDNAQERTVIDLNAFGATKFYHVEIAKP